MEAAPPLLPLPRNPTGIAVLAVSSVGIFVDLIVIGLRLWARRLKRKRLDIGDYLIIIAWVRDRLSAFRCFFFTYLPVTDEDEPVSCLCRCHQKNHR
jgi:hypothetical protein